MSVRVFEERDRVALRDVYLHTRQQTFNWLDSDRLRADEFDQHTEGESIWVYDRSNSVIGFVSAWLPENFIHHLFVLPEFAGRGYGSKLLSVCLANIGRPAQLKCVTDNNPALAFYQARGWRILSRDRSPDNEEYYLMQKDDS